MSVLFVNFKTREIVPRSDWSGAAALRQEKVEFGPIQSRMLKIFERLDYTPSNDMSFYDRITNRFGKEKPRGGVVFKGGIKKSVDGKFYIDSYGRGCVTNCKGNPYKADLERSGYWNRPMPFPQDLATFYKDLLKLPEGATLQLGDASEPFPWMDQKYGVAQEMLHMIGAAPVKINLEIFTGSDLIACDNYIALLQRLSSVKVIMRMPRGYVDGYDSDEAGKPRMRDFEPGGPSLQRREKAMKALKDAGIKVCKFSNPSWEKVEVASDDL